MTAALPIIHVVDDDTTFRTAVARLLRAAGYQVALYESGGLGMPATAESAKPASPPSDRGSHD